MKRKLILLGWAVLAWFGVSKQTVLDNNTVNRAVLQRKELWSQESYIEKQSELGELKFGNKYTMAYGGCGLIALYNAVIALGKEPSTELFVELSESMQRRGAAWGGRYGIHPAAIRKWLARHGFEVKRLGVTRKSLAENQMKYDVFIVTSLNGSSLKNWVHTVCITRTAKGFMVHNGSLREPVASLAEAVEKSSSRGATPLYAMGVGSGQERADKSFANI